MLERLKVGREYGRVGEKSEIWATEKEREREKT